MLLARNMPLRIPRGRSLSFNVGCCCTRGSASSSSLTKRRLCAFLSVWIQKKCRRRWLLDSEDLSTSWRECCWERLRSNLRPDPLTIYSNLTGSNFQKLRYAMNLTLGLCPKYHLSLQSLIGLALLIQFRCSLELEERKSVWWWERLSHKSITEISCESNCLLSALHGTM